MTAEGVEHPAYVSWTAVHDALVIMQTTHQRACI